MEKTLKTVRRMPNTAGMGFTVIEVLVVIALVGIMASIVIPRMGFATRGKVQAKTAAREFSNYLKLTRSLAITNGSIHDKGYELELSEDSGSYTSYEIKDKDTDEIVKGPITIPTGVTVTCTKDKFKFKKLGQLDEGSTQTVQFSKEGVTSVVSVTPIGRITVQ